MKKVFIILLEGVNLDVHYREVLVYSFKLFLCELNLDIRIMSGSQLSTTGYISYIYQMLPKSLTLFPSYTECMR